MQTLSAISAATALTSSALATVSSTLVADTYIVKDGVGASARFYAVLDVYAKGNHPGDVMGGILGLSEHSVVFATNKAQGVTRDNSGRVTAGSISSDIFVQSGGSSWNPNNADGKAWDSFVANGNRVQNASVVNRAGVTMNLGDAAKWWTFGFSQMDVANSNFINNGSQSGWFTEFGNNPYLGGASGTIAVNSENPWSRASLYNGNWTSSYPSLDRSRLASKGALVNGASSSSAAWASRINPTITNLISDTAGVGGFSLDFHSMIGRFAIDVTGRSATEEITMNVQFNMTGRNGISNESGDLFSGAFASTPNYQVSQFFAFAVPAPAAITLLGVAGLVRRRRTA
jgi:hypothetical protein